MLPKIRRQDVNSQRLAPQPIAISVQKYVGLQLRFLIHLKNLDFHLALGMPELRC